VKLGFFPGSDNGGYGLYVYVCSGNSAGLFLLGHPTAFIFSYTGFFFSKKKKLCTNSLRVHMVQRIR